MRNLRATIGLALALALGPLAVALAAAPGADPLRWTLDNGLRVRLVPLALRVQADRLDRPEFSATTLEREIPRTLAEIDFVEQSPPASPGKLAVSACDQAVLSERVEVLIRARTRTLTLDDVHRHPDHLHLVPLRERSNHALLQCTRHSGRNNSPRRSSR